MPILACSLVQNLHSWQHWLYNFSNYKCSPNTIENWPSRRFWQNCKPQACCNSYNLWQKVHIFWKFRNVISLLSSSSFKFMTFLPLQLSILQTWHGGFVNLCWQLQPNSLTLNFVSSFITVKLFKLHICAHNYSDTLELLLKWATNFYFLNTYLNESFETKVYFQTWLYEMLLVVRHLFSLRL